MSFFPLFFLALSNYLSFLEPFKDSFSADRLMSFFLTLSSFSLTTRLDYVTRQVPVSTMCSQNTITHQNVSNVNTVKTVLV